MSLDTFYNLTDERQNNIIQNGIKEFSSKSYTEASTDTIIKECGISKGILFHYFGSKKNFYLYILDYCVKVLTREKITIDGNNFYEVLFKTMDRKIMNFKKYPLEIRFVNMAAKETNRKIADEKNQLLTKYMVKAQKESSAVIKNAAKMIPLKFSLNRDKIVQALSMYTNTIVMRYLEIYKEKPDDFFKNSELIKLEVKEYIDFILYGIMEG